MEHHLAFSRGCTHEEHRKLNQHVVDSAKKSGAGHTIVLSRSSGDEKNPLTPEQKLKHARRALSKGANVEIASAEKPNLLHYAAELHKKGVKTLHFHGGSDRREMHELLKKYNGKEGKHGYFKFDNIHFHQHGEERTEGGKAALDPSNPATYSGTNIRNAARSNDRRTLHRVLPQTLSHRHKEDLINDLQSGLKSAAEKKKPRKKINEEHSNSDFGSLLKSFSEFAAKELDLKKAPKVSFKPVEDDTPVRSFGGYNPFSREIILQTKNRHPMDVFRTLAHEFVHAKQHEDDKIGHDIEKEGETGSCHENEANSVAGVIMRKFGRKHPEYFELESLKEAVFVVGPPCCGKDVVIKELKESNEAFEYDISYFNKNYPSDEKIIVNAPAHDYNSIRTANEALKQLNYETSLIFVDVENNISKLRNEQRSQKGQRVITENVRFAKFSQSNENKEKFKELFGENMSIINNNLTEEVKKPTGKLKKACWKGYTAVGMKMKNGKKVPNCVPVSEADKKFEKHMADDKIGTAGVNVNPTSLYEKDKCGCDTKKPKKIFRKRLAQEAENGSKLTTASGAVGLPVSDSLGAEFGVAKSPSIISGLTGVTPVSQGATAMYPFGTYGISESVIDWMNKPETQEKFSRKYGELAEQKLIQTGIAITESMNTSVNNKPKHFNQIRENWEALGGRDSGTVPATARYKDVSEDWSDVKHQDPSGGLKASGVRAYRRENPGSKLKTAVRTEPSKLKKGGKRWKRRKSFCARMSGMKKKLTSSKTANDPNSRINKSLRAWNCEE